MNVDKNSINQDDVAALLSAAENAEKQMRELERAFKNFNEVLQRSLTGSNGTSGRVVHTSHKIGSMVHNLVGCQSYYDDDLDMYFYQSTCRCGERSPWHNIEEEANIFIQTHAYGKNRND